MINMNNTLNRPAEKVNNIEEQNANVYRKIFSLRKKERKGKQLKNKIIAMKNVFDRLISSLE